MLYTNRCDTAPPIPYPKLLGLSDSKNGPERATKKSGGYHHSNPWYDVFKKKITYVHHPFHYLSPNAYRWNNYDSEIGTNTGPRSQICIANGCWTWC